MYLYRQKKNKNLHIIIVFIIALVIGIGYAFLTSDLSIMGDTEIKDNTWDVHLTRLRSSKVRTAEGPDPTITNGNTINYSVTLNNPGDRYEIHASVENSGSIDAMIDSITTTQLTEEQQKYLDYSYSIAWDGCGQHSTDKLFIKKNTIVPEYSSTTLWGDWYDIEITISYKYDIQPEDIPDEPQTLNLSFTLNTVQADKTAINPTSTCHSGGGIVSSDPI